MIKIKCITRCLWDKKNLLDINFLRYWYYTLPKHKRHQPHRVTVLKLGKMGEVKEPCNRRDGLI